MKILLINVALRPKSPVKFLPLGLAYIGTALKNAGFTFDLLDVDAYRYSDDEIRAFLAKNHYDVILMGCIITGYKTIKEYARMIREFYPDSIIIAGNSVADSIPDILLSKTETNIAVIGEGDITIVELLDALENGKALATVQGIVFKTRDSKIYRTPDRPPIKNLSEIPIIDYSMWDMEAYIEGYRNSLNEPTPLPRSEIRGIAVNTARGCVNRCTFCYHVFRNVPYRHRPWKHVIEEVRHLIENYRINYIGFHDELTFSSKHSVREFIEAVKGSGLHFFWTADCRGNLFTLEEDLELLQTLKEIGCVGMGYSLESSCPEILAAMNKNMTPEQFTFQTSLFIKAGIPAWTSLVFGFPQETPETIKSTIDCCIQNGIYPSAGYLLPFPGSEMYQHAIDRGIIDKDDEEEYLLKLGDRQDLRVNLTTMSDTLFQKVLNDELQRCNKELKIGLLDQQLTKTQYYRSPKERGPVKKI
ncbi:B12-binding domain-containing radical SAM protein [Methanoculleus horonobensis]|uniref:B12-binding domain-containing radical SAM protein n=1 Tax=Methanoculleus horonobensis TaxID=528314 RepID=UPI000835E6E8|nr:radical SAM protein [Methanoculleus horonobensis]